MTKPHKKRGKEEFRHFVSPPAPPNEAVEARLIDLLTPGTFASLKTVEREAGALRDRVLSLSVMSAIVVSLVYRQVRYLSELLRVLEQEGLLWVEAQRVSKQALSKRLVELPASLFLGVFEQVAQRIRQRPLASGLIAPEWQGVQGHFSALWIADGSTLERLQRQMGQLRGQSNNPLAGKMMMVVEAFSHRPVQAFYSPEPNRNDVTWWAELMALLPVGGLLILDLGFFGFPAFDAMSQDGKFFLTRQKQKVSYKVTAVLSRGSHYRDEIIQMGQHHTHPCQHPLRQVSLLWGKQWRAYLTNVLDPQLLSPQQVCDLYRRRWHIEDAFLLTKRLLGLAYLWVGSRNGVQIQLYATWIFYAVLNDLCSEVAVALAQPLEKISMEMVFRSLYHFAQAQQRDASTQLIPFLVRFQKSFGLVKAQRKRKRKNDALSLDIWVPALS
jgi:Transposase DDE domain